MQPFIEKTIIFPKEGPTVCRIPSIVVSSQGTVLAFASKRIGSHGDFGHDSDIVLRRSLDGGKSWESVQTLATEEGVDHHAGPSLVDYETKRIFKFYRKWPACVDGPEHLMRETVVERPEKWKKWGIGTYFIHSDDEGGNWSKPIFMGLKHPDAVGRTRCGNGIHGIQLPDGRLVIQGTCPASMIFPPQHDNDTRSFLIYSDDHGETWKIGATWSPGYAPQEFCLLQSKGNRILVNQRSFGPHRRSLIVNSDEWTASEMKMETALPESVCHASMIRLTSSETDDRDRVLFANPAVENTSGEWDVNTRIMLTVRISYDEAETWKCSKVIEEGKSAYSDLAIAEDGTILCAYENGPERYNDQISVARFNLEWLTDGADYAG